MYKHIYIYIQNFIHKHTYATHIHRNTHTHTHTHLSPTYISVQFLFCSCLSFFQLRTVMMRCWEQPVILGFLTCLEQSPRLFKKSKRLKQKIDACTHTHRHTTPIYSHEVCPGNLETAQQAAAGAVLLAWELSCHIGVHA